jgi:Sap, sulfolipid-1-addressing protein
VTVADLALIGLAVTLEPLPIMAFILVLASRRGPRKGLAFIIGWMACLVLVIVITLLVTAGRPPRPSTAPSLAISAAKAALGVLLVGLALYRYRHPRPSTGPPRWAAGLDRLSLFMCAALGAFLQPWVLVGAAASAVAGIGTSSWVSILLLAGFCLLATATQIGMELAVVLAPTNSARQLERLRHALDVHRDRALVVIAAVVGLWLLGNGLSAMVSS